MDGKAHLAILGLLICRGSRLQTDHPADNTDLALLYIWSHTCRHTRMLLPASCTLHIVEPLSIVLVCRSYFSGTGIFPMLSRSAGNYFREYVEMSKGIHESGAIKFCTWNPSHRNQLTYDSPAQKRGKGKCAFACIT